MSGEGQDPPAPRSTPPTAPGEPFAPPAVPDVALPLPPAEPPGPITARERIEEIDLLRGFAIFGVLLVNMQFYGWPADVAVGTIRWFDWPLDRAAEWLIACFAQGKFYILFSFLFGFGMTVQMQRVETRGGRFGRLYARRLLILLAFGLAHAVLLWWGDILTTYALVGFILLLFRRRRNVTVLIWALIVYFLPLLAIAFGTGMVLLVESVGMGTELQAGFERARQEGLLDIQRALWTYRHGSWLDILGVRLSELTSEGGIGFLFTAPTVLALFLAGLYVGRAGLLHNVAAHRKLLGRVLLICLPIGLALNATSASIFVAIDRLQPNAALLGSQVAWWFGGPLLTADYVAVLLLAFQTPRGRALLGPFASVGRMALSNYILQSVICTTLFYSYGFKLYGQLGPAAGLGVALLIYAAQIPLSVWWLRRFRFGPLEWLWRTLTYGRLQPLRIAAAAAGPPAAAREAAPGALDSSAGAP